MTRAFAAWRRLPFLMSDKPKSPWGDTPGGNGGNDDAGDSNDPAGPRNPWAQPPGGQRGRAPRASGLEELLKRARGGGGGGNGGGGNFRMPGGESARSIWLAGAGIILLMWILFTSVHIIGTQDRGVVTFLGRYSRTLSPGVSLTLPSPLTQVQMINTTGIQTFSFPDTDSSGNGSGGGGANLVLTRDGNLVDLSYSVQWNITDPEKFAFELNKPEEAIKATAESAVRAVIANSTLDDVLGPGKLAIQTQIADAMQKILDDYQSGVHIVGVALNTTQPPQPVMDAFKNVTAAQNDRQSALAAARGYALQVIANAEGSAAAFNAVYEQYKLAPEVTRRRMYYDTMDQILPKNDKTIVEPRNVAPYLPLPGIKKAPDTPDITVTGAR